MLTKPRNYEEAEKIIRDAMHDDIYNHLMAVRKTRMYIIGILGIIATIVCAIVSKEPKFIVAALPLVFIIDLPFIVQVYVLIYCAEKVNTALYKSSDEEVIKVASEYVDEYNTFEEKRMRKHKRKKAEN